MQVIEHGECHGDRVSTRLWKLASIQPKVCRNPQRLYSSFSYLKAGLTVMNHYVVVCSMLMPLMIETVSPGSLLRCLLIKLFDAFQMFKLIFLPATFCPVHWPHSTACSCPLCSSSLYICQELLPLPFSFYYVKQSHSSSYYYYHQHHHQYHHYHYYCSLVCRVLIIHAVLFWILSSQSTAFMGIEASTTPRWDSSSDSGADAEGQMDFSLPCSLVDASQEQFCLSYNSIALLIYGPLGMH